MSPRAALLLALLPFAAVSLQSARQVRRWNAGHRPVTVTQLVNAEYCADLATTAAVLVSPGKGILVSDETDATLDERMFNAGILDAPSKESRKAYRELLYTAPDLGKFVSGAILTADMLHETLQDGTPLVNVLNSAGILPGVRMDLGDAPLPGALPGECFTLGLDTLQERAKFHKERGARFGEWRARFKITSDLRAPSMLALKENCWTLARAARTMQEVGLVPLLEPAIFLGGDHPIELAAEVQERVYSAVFQALSDNGVFLEGVLLKPSMTLPGSNCIEEVKPELIAAYSVRTLERTVPSAVAGVTFNSGGLSEEEASLCLDAMNRIERKGPWSVTFGFARTLQQSSIRAWAGDAGNAAAAQQALLARCRANGEANLGKYVPGSQPSTDDAFALRGTAAR
ncbi:fructose-1,6-bisphosphate aldolase [Pelagophyceae sp. CCMP2097]|nr:fructose-1,6-bisphosphate aldolase [Pelagophyceae sp. CCMP2097]